VSSGETRLRSFTAITDRVAGPVRVKLEVRGAVPGGGSANVTAKAGDGFLRVVRYPAALDH
jgi:hypothetical protein